METNKIYSNLRMCIEDPRQQGKVIHAIENIFIITICASICGADTWEDIFDFGIKKKNWLEKFLNLENGIPSPDTISRLFSAIKVSEFEAFFLSFVEMLLDKNDEIDYVAIDGKTLRGSYDKKSKKSAIHMVSAWSLKHNCVIGQVKTEEKSNEITAIPKLLKVLELENTIVTIDAMGTQKKIVETIIDNKGDYILALKGNHPKLEKKVVDYFDELSKDSYKNIKFTEENEKGHGRIENRKYWITELPESIDVKNNWKGLLSIGMTESTRNIHGKISVQKKYYITSITPDEKIFATATRKHWGIENSLHWCLDVGFREDACRIRKGAASENIAIVRHIALNLLRNEKTSRRGIAGKRFNAALDDKYLMKVLGIHS